MHSANHDKRRADASDLRWQVTTALGAQFVCTVWVIGARIEVRLTEQDELLCAAGVASLDAASDVARKWLRTVVTNNGVGDLIPGPRVDAVH